MNEIQQLEKVIKETFPDAHTKIEKPLLPNGFWSLDITINGKVHDIDWSTERPGFGLCTCEDPKEHGFGCGPDIICTDIESTIKKLTELISR